MPTRTVPRPASTVVRTLRAEVVTGKDRGATTREDRERISVGTAKDNDLVLTDSSVSRYHVELSVAEGGVLVEDHRSTNGTTVGGVQIERGLVQPGATLRLGETDVRVTEGAATRESLYEASGLGAIRGRSAAIRRLMALIEKAAQSNASVLAVGESGTGKELVAQSIHELGPRSGGPFITVDCGSLTPTLVASELFGHRSGAFTGATRDHVGAFERANGGTLFLDEIGELPAEIQTSLLGVLERSRFRRVGGDKDISVDVRIICATHRDLRTEVNAGNFRADLYYRIAVVTLRVPALRDRPDDIPLLVDHFMKEAGHDGPMDDIASPDTLDALVAHSWPGNVRELRNMVEALLVLGDSSDVHEQLRGAPSPAGGAEADLVGRVLNEPYKDARRVVLEDFERRYIGHRVERAGGNVAKAARDAKMDRTYLIQLLRRHRLNEDQS